MAVTDFRMFWGKARAGAIDEALWHPLSWHLLDVSAVICALLRVRPTSRRTGARLLGCSEVELIELMASLAVLHDIGKFSPTFQRKAPEFWPRVLGTPEQFEAADRGHPQDGWLIWHRALSRNFSEMLWSGDSFAVDALLLAAFGHHGRPIVTRGGRRDGEVALAIISPHVEACIGELLPLVHSGNGPQTPLSENAARYASWWVNGLLTVADWVGSGRHWFPYTAPDVSPEEYWKRAQIQAGLAVEEAGLREGAAANRGTFSWLTGIEHAATPMQKWADSVDLPDGPVLAILEDVTGSGKTEAAQVLIHRLMSEGRAAGAYWALPTQATANAMYVRQRAAIGRLFAPGLHLPSLVLAHAQSRLHPAFRADVLHGATESDAALGEISDPDNLPATSACSAWLADNRRAALLADVGAGTIDQALMGILPTKFNTMRVVGLADKVLIVDEAHAYDSYVGQELATMLELQAANGGHAVILSATLTHRLRDRLIDAWRTGMYRRVTAPPPPSAVANAFPLATLVSASATNVLYTPVTAAKTSTHELHLRVVHSVDDAIAQVMKAVSIGASIAWIRNTVSSCVEAAAELTARGIVPTVFHSRFTQGDRQVLEAALQRDFGVDSKLEQRQARVIVATQVIEQSLDLDFDVMISDLAPIDLLLQRAGRLWRHRKRDVARPVGVLRELRVLMPSVSEAPTASWPAPLLPGTNRVYPHVDVLWRTAALIGEHRRVKLPQHSRDLVEEAYGDAAVPSILDSAADRATASAQVARATAQYVAITIDDGYIGNGVQWSDDMHPTTRLTDATTTLRLARRDVSGRLCAWCEGYADVVDPWAASEVRVRSALLGDVEHHIRSYTPEVARTVSYWPDFERTIPVVVLTLLDESMRWTGPLQSIDSWQRTLLYSDLTGLSVTRSPR